MLACVKFAMKSAVMCVNVTLTFGLTSVVPTPTTRGPCWQFKSFLFDYIQVQNMQMATDLIMTILNHDLSVNKNLQANHCRQITAAMCCHFNKLCQTHCRHDWYNLTWAWTCRRNTSQWLHCTIELICLCPSTLTPGGAVNDSTTWW